MTRCSALSPRYPLAMGVVLLGLLAILSIQREALAVDAVAPTFADVPYGPFERNLLDFWQAPSITPTPLIVEIHGGGFYEGDKRGFSRHVDDIARCREQGVSLAAINYRFIEEAPLSDILRDAARAIQFLRSKAHDWNIDPHRVAAFGESAGAGASLWLAFHDDLADPANADPVLRESTRLTAAGALAPQSTYDFAQWPAILRIPEAIWHISTWYVSPAYYHVEGWRPYLTRGRALRRDVDFLSEIDSSDPPVYLRTNHEDRPIIWTRLAQFAGSWIMANVTGKELKVDPAMNIDILHHPAHVHALEAACADHAVSCTAVYRDTPEAQKISVIDFLLQALLTPRAQEKAQAHAALEPHAPASDPLHVPDQPTASPTQ